MFSIESLVSTGYDTEDLGTTLWGFYYRYYSVTNKQTCI